MDFFNLRPVRCPNCSRIILKGDQFDELLKSGLPTEQAFELVGYRNRPLCCKMALSNPSQQAFISNSDNLIETKTGRSFEQKTKRSDLISEFASMDLEDELVFEESGQIQQQYVGQFNGQRYSVPVLKRVFDAI